MKRCPECRRDYYDDSLTFCLADGSELVYGLMDDEPATAVLHAAGSTAEAPTRPKVLLADKASVAATAGPGRQAERHFRWRVVVVPVIFAVLPDA